MKKYIVIMALVSGFAPWSMQAMNQPDLTVATSDEQQVIIPRNRIHYFETLNDIQIDTVADNSAIPLPILKSTMQQLLTDLRLIVNQLHVANTEDQAIAHVTVQSKITELSEQDFINARNAAQFLQSDLLVQLYDAKAIVPILISDASMQSLYNNNAEHMQRIRSINPIFKNEIYQYIKVDDAWFETNTLTRHTRGIRSAAFSPDGIKIVTISDDNTTKIWDVLTGKCLHALDGRHTALVRSAIFSPDRTKIVTGFENGTAKIWDVLTGQCHTLAGHTGGIDSAAFSPDGNVIVAASYDNTVRIWDALTGEFLHALEGHTERVDSVVFSPDGKKIVTASADRTAKIWNASTGQCLHTLKGHTDWVRSAAFSPDGNVIVTASADRTAKIWNALTGECLHTLEGHAERVCSAAFSPDGTKIVTASWDNTAKIWDASTGEYLHTLESHSNWVFSAAFSPDGNAIVTASDDYTAKIWQLFPAHNFDQALFARLLAWAKRKGHAAVWQTEWARSVMNTYSAEDQALIKKWYPPQTQTIMQRISGYLSLLDA